MTKPRVSVVCITYNHEKFIAQALEGFAKQKTEFELEVIVADDASTDKTQQIIERYRKKYPSIFRPILRKTNIGAVNNCIDALKSASGDYIALCEGDDYWTSDDKIQRQASFLERNPSYFVCFHPVKVVFDGSDEHDYIFPSEKGPFTLKKLLKRNYIQTNAVMYRKKSYEKLPTNVLPLDWYLHLYHAKSGKIGFIDQVMSVYRRHPGGMWWESDRDVSKIWEKYGLSHLNLYLEIGKLFKNEELESQKIINKHINNTLGNLMEVDTKLKTGLLHDAVKLIPESLETFLVIQHRELIEKRKKIKLDEAIIAQLTEKLNMQAAKLAALDQELAEIKNSKLWKVRKVQNKMKRSTK